MRQLLSRVTLSILTIGAMEALHAKQHCDLKDLDGKYGMFATGNINFAPPPFGALVGPFARVGSVVADGKGHFAVSNTASYNGFILPETYTANYTVSDSCAVIVDTIVPLPIPSSPPVTLIPVPFQFAGSLADDGKDLSVVMTSVGGGPPGATIRVHLRREDNNSSGCSNKDLNGGYQLDLAGVNVSLPPAGPYVREGILVFDGKGGVAGSTIVSYSGFVIVPDNFIGTYSVDAACALSINFTSGLSFTLTGALTDSSKGAVLIQSAPAGAVVQGTLRQQ
jgi:hypothetical protein